MESLYEANGKLMVLRFQPKPWTGAQGGFYVYPQTLSYCFSLRAGTHLNQKVTLMLSAVDSSKCHA